MLALMVIQDGIYIFNTPTYTTIACQDQGAMYIFLGSVFQGMAGTEGRYDRLQVIIPWIGIVELPGQRRDLKNTRKILLRLGSI